MYNETLGGGRGGSNHIGPSLERPPAREAGPFVITSDLVVIHEGPRAMQCDRAHRARLHCIAQALSELRPPLTSHVRNHFAGELLVLINYNNVLIWCYFDLFPPLQTPFSLCFFG